MIQDYVCKYDGHEDEPVQGFCLSQNCQSKYQWCVQCFTSKHLAHAEDCKSFVQIKQMIKNYSNIISDWIKNTNDEFDNVLNQYKNVTKFLENEKNKMIELEQLLNEKNYQSFKDDLQYVKQWKNISLTKIINDNIISKYVINNNIIYSINQFNTIKEEINQRAKVIKQNDNYAKGIQHKENKEYDLALQCLEDAIKESALNSLAWCQKGWVLYQNLQII